MSVKFDLEKAFLALRGSPSFDEFVKTLAARREFVVSQMIGELNSSNVDVLRGEARAYDYLLKAATPRA
jgi:hypothetical protein